MSGLRRRIVGTVLEIRLLPVVMWSFTALTLGTAIGTAESGEPAVGRYLLAVLIGVLIQGLVAHSVNDIADWRSGTDRHPSPRSITGGSKVIPLGLLSERGLLALGVVAGVSATASGIAAAARFGWDLVPFGAVGMVGAVVYTLAPTRAAYRPVAGEVVAFCCMAACVLGAARLQAGEVPRIAWLAAGAHAGACVAMLMVHHLPDRLADRAADPPKRTTPSVLGDQHVWYTTAWACAALACAIALANREPATVPVVCGAAVAIVAAWWTRHDAPRTLLVAELTMMAAVTIGGLASAAMLAPALTWALLVPGAAVGVELLCVGAARRVADVP